MNRMLSLHDSLGAYHMYIMMHATMEETYAAIVMIITWMWLHNQTFPYVISSEEYQAVIIKICFD